MTCSWCGSTEMEAIEWYGPTGVVAPDGGREYWMQRGYRCRACGQVGEK
jgi:hypothetical protein